jgi:hypothetical protein
MTIQVYIQETSLVLNPEGRIVMAVYSAVWAWSATSNLRLKQGEAAFRGDCERAVAEWHFKPAHCGLTRMSRGPQTPQSRRQAAFLRGNFQCGRTKWQVYPFG